MTDTHETPGILLGGEKYLTITEVAVLVHRCEMTVYRYVKARKLPKPNNMKLFKESEVLEYMTRRS